MIPTPTSAFVIKKKTFISHFFPFHCLMSSHSLAHSPSSLQNEFSTVITSEHCFSQERHLRKELFHRKRPLKNRLETPQPIKNYSELRCLLTEPFKSFSTALALSALTQSPTTHRMAHVASLHFKRAQKRQENSKRQKSQLTLLSREPISTIQGLL